MVKMTLLDRLLCEEPNPIFTPLEHKSAMSNRMTSFLKDAVSFDITNIAEYVVNNNVLADWERFALGGPDSCKYDPDIIVCGPMYQVMWFEYDKKLGVTTHDECMKSMITKPISRGEDDNFVIGITENIGLQKSGWLITATDLKNPQITGRDISDFQQSAPDYLFNLEGVRWYLQAHSYSYAKTGSNGKKLRQLTGPNYLVSMYLDKHGKLLGREMNPAYRKAWGDAPKLDPLCWGDCFLNLLPVIMAMTFMNCRGVKQEAVTPGAKRSRVHRKKTNQDLVTYNHLDINTSKSSGGQSSNESEESIARRLHICRGHFRHYTEENPLFGSYVGPVWIPAHIRGSEEEGIIHKDYEVKR